MKTIDSASGIRENAPIHPSKVISASLHYFRMERAYWHDRLCKLKAMGCNTVDTYIPWNLHEPQENVYCFDGNLDVVAFLTMAQDLGLCAIVRPSPCVCKDWEFGGLPAWLLAIPGMKIRSSKGPFLSKIEQFYTKLLAKLVPLQTKNGGNILFMQVESTKDAEQPDDMYLERLREIVINAGISITFVAVSTCDLHEPNRIEALLSDTNSDKHQNKVCCTDFHACSTLYWGEGQKDMFSIDYSAQVLERLLDKGNVNIGTFCNGINPGFMNGSQHDEKAKFTCTQYHQDAPLTVDGRKTQKYYAFQRVIRKYTQQEGAEHHEQARRHAYGDIQAWGFVSLFHALERLSKPVTATYPRSMEELNQSYGYVLYRSFIPANRRINSFRLWEAADRAQIFLKRKKILTLIGEELKQEYDTNWIIRDETIIDILVENMGRAHMSKDLSKQKKGIAGAVLMNGHIRTTWLQFPLCFNPEEIEGLDFTVGGERSLPTFYKFQFEASEAYDTFLDVDGWGKGCAFINGENIGRFWDIGPQSRLYIPSSKIKSGINNIVIFETEGKALPTISLRDTP